MSDPKMDELAADIDDASVAVEELQGDLETENKEKLTDLRKILEHASDIIDEIGDKKRR